MIHLVSVVLLCTGYVQAYNKHFCANRASTLHADHDDCSRYYSCVGSLTFSLPCPPGLYFNDVYKVCDWPYNVNCYNDDVPTKASPGVADMSTDISRSSVLISKLTTPEQPGTDLTTSHSNETTEPSRGWVTLKSNEPEGSSFVNTRSDSADILNTNFTLDTRDLSTTSATTDRLKNTRAPLPSPIFCAEKKDNLYADPADCGGFYQCHRGYTYHFKCGAGLVFNAQHQYCDWPYNVNCDDQTTLPETRSTFSFQDPSSAQTPEPPTTRPKGRESSPGCNRIVCYVSNWSKYRIGDGRFTVDNVDPNLCTHVIYSFAKLSGNRLSVTEADDEPSNGQAGNFARVTGLKNMNPGLKVLLAIGSWSLSTEFSRMASSKESRDEFVNTTVQFLRERNFDGLDFDWEFPGNETEKELLAVLCEKLRNAFELEGESNNRLLLTVAVSAGKSTIDAAYNIPRMSDAVDFFNLMTYDLHGPWERITGHHSPLLRGSWETGYDAYFNTDWVVGYWVSKGAPKHKMVIGSPLYARTFTLADKNKDAVGAPAIGAGNPGPYTNEAGILSYYEVCLIKDVQTREYFIESQKSHFSVKGNQWFGYDNQETLKEKVRYIKQNGYGGIMLWEISHDDFNGAFCQKGKFPLLTAVNEECYK